MSTFSPNLDLELVARGGDVGTWDTPTNSNWSIMDSVVGGIATIALNNTNVVLSAAQFQAENITFNSTLTGSVTITFASTFIKPYTIGHFCTGSSAFTITLGTTVAGGQVIAIPPGQYCDVVNDGTNIKFKNLPPIASFLDIYTSSAPAWMTGCTVNPWLPCTGVSFSSATYPALATALGSTTTPDCRGTVSAALDQGAGRLTAGSGVGLTGSQSVTLGTSQIPSHTHAVSDPGHTHTTGFNGIGGSATQFFEGQSGAYNVGPIVINGAFTGITLGNTGGGAAVATVQPTNVIGMRFIRAG